MTKFSKLFHGAAFGVLAFCALALVSIGQASAQVACPAGSVNHGGVTLNETHIFCGEYSSNKVKGFHSRPGGVNPTTVSNVTVTVQPDARGIYEITFSMNGKSKSSTMFPDSCSKDQVVKSVLYAYANKANNSACVWGECGPNRPDPKPTDGTETQYCNADNDALFNISLGKPYVNTAFPNR